MERDCQCARCGSSCGWEDCSNCGGEGYIELHERDPIGYSEGDVETCNWCRGEGGGYFCLSGADWCGSHPMAGRENVEHGEIEWFEVDQ